MKHSKQEEQLEQHELLILSAQTKKPNQSMQCTPANCAASRLTNTSYYEPTLLLLFIAVDVAIAIAVIVGVNAHKMLRRRTWEKNKNK